MNIDMTRGSRRLAVVVLVPLVVVSLTMVASAQDPDPVPQPDDSSTEVEDAREALQERLSIMRAWRLTEVIEVDQATSLLLFERLDVYDAEVRPLHERLRELGRSLRQLLESGEGTDEEVQAIVDAVLDTHLAIETAKVSLIRDAGTFLEPRHQAALMLFIPEFEREVQRLIREARGQTRGGAEREGRRGSADNPEGRPNGRPNRHR